MQPVQDLHELGQALATLRGQLRQPLTNLYLTGDTLAQWGRLGRLYQFRSQGCLLLAREENGFYHVYFLAASAADLDETAAALERLAPAPLVIDLIGPESKLEALETPWRAQGFTPYRRFVRLWRPGPVEQQGGDELVRPASPPEADAICALLHQEFDPYCEHLPSQDEVRSSVAGAEVLLATEGELAALLYFERTGVTSNLRYWYVRPVSRGRQFGSRLMRSYFAASVGLPRMILWVDDQNVGAREIYAHYGYRADGLTDHIFMRTAP